jgi:hypothetical protein
MTNLQKIELQGFNSAVNGDSYQGRSYNGDLDMALAFALGYAAGCETRSRLGWL